jgi:Rad3-related DNA helicase
MIKNLKDFTPRPQQVKILDFVKDSVSKNKKFILIDSPTGTGKSYAAILISEWYREEINKKAKIDILTNTKILQDQYSRDFSFLANLKGKNNYWCRSNGMNCGEGTLLNSLSESKCKICPYKIAQERFISNKISLTNFHLLTTYSMYASDLLEERKSNLLIIDECHGFEEVFCDFISSYFSEKYLTQFEIWEPNMELDLESINTIYQLSDWVKNKVVPKMENKRDELLESVKKTRGKSKKLDILRKSDYIDKALCKYNRFVEDSDSYEVNWIFEKDLDQFGNTKFLVEPIWAGQYLNDLFWKKYDHVIFMSGTILNPNLFSKIMGLGSQEYTYLSLPCPFDAKKRPVVYLKYGKMSFYNKKETFSKTVPILKKIISKNINNKGIIHSATYELTSWIQNSIPEKRFIFHTSADREKALSNHISSSMNTIIVSPSMINGIDLKDDLSRFQVILKVPFPNLTSLKIKKRLESNPEWYSWKTLVDILQQYGRSIRNEEDWAETYILDECFDQVLSLNYLPQYFKDALIIKKLNSSS